MKSVPSPHRFFQVLRQKTSRSTTRMKLFKQLLETAEMQSFSSVHFAVINYASRHFNEFEAIVTAFLSTTGRHQALLLVLSAADNSVSNRSIANELVRLGRKHLLTWLLVMHIIAHYRPGVYELGLRTALASCPETTQKESAMSTKKSAANRIYSIASLQRALNIQLHPSVDVEGPEMLLEIYEELKKTTTNSKALADVIEGSFEYCRRLLAEQKEVPTAILQFLDHQLHDRDNVASRAHRHRLKLIDRPSEPGYTFQLS